MEFTHPWVKRWSRGSTTMLGQVRTLYLCFLLLWPLFGLWGIAAGNDTATTTIVLAVTVVLAAWLYVGYRRERFPAWSWIAEGLCVGLVATASDYRTTVGLCFMWVNFRALYGRLREKVLATVVLAAIMAYGMAVVHTSADSTVPLFFTATISLMVNHMLARGSSARDRSAAREKAASAAGAGLVASATREEAMDVTLGAALSMDSEVGAALLVTRTGSTLHVVAAAGRVGTEAAGWVTEMTDLPEQARAALNVGGYALLSGDPAADVVDALRLPRHPVVVLAALAVNGESFGALLLALDGRPKDDLSAPVTTLAGEAALTLDQLLVRSRLSAVVDHSPDALMLASEVGTIRFVNPAGELLLGAPGADLAGRNLWSLVHPDDLEALLTATPKPSGSAPAVHPCRIRGDGTAGWTDVEAGVEYVSEHDGSRSIVFHARDVSERQHLELELRHAQKLESVGRLAAGIAHEINTPIQFVGDNVRFLESAFADLQRLLDAYGELVAVAGEPDGRIPAALKQVEAVATEIDIEFLAEEAPLAIAQSLEGINRVANIVRAMKAFGHPGTDEKAQADLNEAIGHTLVVANNEIKYVADVAIDLGDLPMVHCHLGDINQVVLNLLVNAAHAIGSADRGRGTIRVSTRHTGEQVLIEVADTGTGVPAEIADKLFDPFFTTKEVGTGTGQGLALVRSLVVDRHGGTIDFTTEAGVGTVFTVRLPVVAGRPADDRELATGAVR